MKTSVKATHKKGDADVLQWRRRWRGRDEQQQLKPGPSEHADLLDELIRVVNEAQVRDAADERRLYDPKLGGQPLFF
jgi:hypothetical protein